VAFLSRSGLPKPSLRHVRRWDWMGFNWIACTLAPCADRSISSHPTN
jgi:hypothetical protein